MSSALAGSPQDIAAGNVCFEAEHANTLAYPFKVNELQKAAGGKVLAIPEGAGSMQAFGGEKPAAVYHLELPATESWHAWLRVKWNGECSNSLFFKLGEGVRYNVTTKTHHRWHWVSAGKWTPQKTSVQARLIDREDGVKVDQVLLTRKDDVRPKGKMTSTTVPTPEVNNREVELFMASASAELPPPDFIFSHNPGQPLALRPVRRVVLASGESAHLTCWLRNNSTERREVTVRLRTTAAVEVEPAQARKVRLNADEPLKKVAFRITPESDMVRGVKRLAISLQHPSGRIEVRKALLEKPFQWLVTNALPCPAESGVATPSELEEKIGKTFPGDVGDVDWHVAPREAINKYGMVNLRRAVADRNYVMAYAFTRIRAPREKDYLLEVRHDDMINIRVNGKKVFTSMQSAPSYITRKLIKVHLRKGINRILVKVSQKKNYWEFCTRILDMNGHVAPVTGVTSADLIRKETGTQ